MLSKVYTEKFLSRISKNGPIVEYVGTPCWLWQGAITKKGYGHFWANGTNRRAHRISWEIHYGPIPPDLWVLHKCDNRACVNPDHLYLGTAKENALDRELRDRSNHACGDSNGARLRPETRPRGERNKSAKLTEAQVMEIRFLRKNNGISCPELAKRYHVSSGAIKSIIRGDTWQHLLSNGFPCPQPNGSEIGEKGL